MITRSYRLLRPRQADGHAPYVGLIISDSFTNLRITGGRSYECMGDILDAWYLCTGQVVLGIVVGGAASTAAGRTRYAAIARWVAWAMTYTSASRQRNTNRSKVKATCCSQYALAKKS